ncbi:MAG: GAF domain-containing protein [Anaerolineae bacterium]|nr:GAF domain-containing protein [Anaerolineae bacterium]
MEIENKLPVDSQDEAALIQTKRDEAFGRLSLLVTALCFAVAIAHFFAAWSLDAWQYVVTGGMTILAGLGYLGVRQLLPSHRFTLTRTLAWLIPFALFPPMALFWSHAVLSLVMAVVVSQIFLGIILYGRKRSHLAIAQALVGGALVLAFDALTLWPRYDVTSSWLSRLVMAVVPAGAILVLFMSLIRGVRRVRTIRARLTVAFVVVVLLGVGIASVGSIVVAQRNAIEQAYIQLQSLMTLKKEMIATWVDDLFLDLDTLLAEEYEISRARMLLSETGPESLVSDARQRLRIRFVRLVSRVQRFDELFLLTPNGKVVLSSDQTQEGKFVTYEAYFQKGLQERYISPPTYVPSTGKASIVVVQPIIDQYGSLLGVLGGRANMAGLNALMLGSAPLGESGEVYLVGINQALLTDSRFGESGYLQSQGISDVLREQNSAQNEYVNYRGALVMGVYTWLPDLKVALLVEMERAEVLRSSQGTIWVNVVMAVISTGLAVIIANFFTQDISLALAELSNVAARISGGEEGLVAKTDREDEIGVLAQAFNSMTGQMRELIGGLERRVEERTQSLAAVAEVSRATTSVLDPAKLLPQVVSLVQERFDLYYVGLFLVNETGDSAVLRAGTGDAGQQMMERGWQLTIGGESMIGQCVATGRPGVRQTEGDIVVRFENPFLPLTRSELALPLRYGTQVIGAMTVQSVQESAFDKTSIDLLQNMADQVAVAVENARLFTTTQQALARAYDVQRRYQAQAWEEYMTTRPVTGYELSAAELVPLGEELLPDVLQMLRDRRPFVEGDKLIVPIIQDDRIVGVLGFEGPAGQTEWGSEEIALVEALSEQLLLAAENQRLLDQTQRSAARERTIGEVTGHVRQALDMQGVLRTAVDELQQVLKLERVVVRMVPRDELEA